MDDSDKKRYRCEDYPEDEGWKWAGNVPYKEDYYGKKTPDGKDIIVERIPLNNGNYLESAVFLNPTDKRSKKEQPKEKKRKKRWNDYLSDIYNKLKFW